MIMNMRKQRFSKQIIYALLSFAAPIVALSATLIYQSIANSSLRESITAEYSAAGAMTAFAEFIQLIVFTAFGCFIGIIFASISLWLQRRIVGMAALIFNGLPFLLLMSFWIKGILNGL